ncbi:MAG TPA: DUF4268 domain-containing protein, partial [Planctomycetaceae bacterium]|nr:DUF4268 domain-containing protein [Planctomycetaceae bacterium]
EVWKHEALDFTTWLQENMDTLGDVIDFEFVGAEREQSAGAFSVDLVAEDSAGNTVIIENQLEKSNHDHLGKVITYLVAMEAKIAIWIVSDPRPEHVAAIAWLNESSSADFYLLKVEAIRIGESSPAPLLTLIVGPSDEGKEVGRTKQELAEQYVIRKRFWTELLERARHKSRLHAAISASRNHWVGASAGIAGLSYNYVARKQDARVELYIDRGKGCEDENREIFAKLQANQAAIEEAFGGRLEWQSIEGRRACRICKVLRTGGYRSDEGKWQQIHDELISAMGRLEEALRPHLRKLRV